MKERIRQWTMLLAIIAVAGCNPSTTQDGKSESGAAPAVKTVPEGTKVKLVYITNGIDPFWNVAAAGTRAAAAKFGVECEVLMPPKGIGDQKRMIETSLTRGVHGIALSPIDAQNQVGLINQACEKTNLVTHDSDAPGSHRMAFIGMDNYKAGRAAGKLVKEILPDGGKVMIFVGRLEQLNAQQRRQGVIDELLDRPMQALTSMQYDDAGAELKGNKFDVVSTRTDNFDYGKAKSNAEDAIAANPDLSGMIGLFAYNIPACLEAVKEAGKTGTIKLVSFDENDSTLQGIVDGTVHGTVSQQPYRYGFDSVRILAALARGDESVLPEGGFLEIPIKVVRKENVKAFWEELNNLRAAGE